MKQYLPLLSAVLVLASCSTAYKTGQTPDDVYFSPERQRDEYVRVEKQDDRRYTGRTEEEVREERYLRMKTSYRRYSILDDCDCYCYTGSNYNRYYDYYRFNNYGYYNSNPYFNNWHSYNYSYNPYYYNPYYNKPYYGGYVAGNVRPIYTKPRTGNLATYNNNEGGYNSSSPKSNTRTYSGSTSSDDNYRGSGTNAGGFLRNVFGSGNSNSSSSSPNSSSSSTKTPSSSSSSSSSGSSSSSSSAPVRKF